MDPRAQRRRLIEPKHREEESARLEKARLLNVRQLFDRWRDTEIQPRLRADGKRTGRKDGGQYVFEQFTRHVRRMIGQIALDGLRNTDLLAVLDAQIATGKLRTADVLLTDLEQRLDFALERELIAEHSHASVKNGKVGAPPSNPSARFPKTRSRSWRSNYPPPSCTSEPRRPSG